MRRALRSIFLGILVTYLAIMVGVILFIFATIFDQMANGADVCQLRPGLNQCVTNRGR